MRRRKSSSSFSVIVPTSWSVTRIFPASGRIRPAASFMIRVFPEPLSPRSTFVSPADTLKETPRKISPSSKPICTSLKTISGSPGLGPVIAALETGSLIGRLPPILRMVTTRRQVRRKLGPRRGAGERPQESFLDYRWKAGGFAARDSNVWNRYNQLADWAETQKPIQAEGHLQSVTCERGTATTAKERNLPP